MNHGDTSSGASCGVKEKMQKKRRRRKQIRKAENRSGGR